MSFSLIKFNNFAARVASGIYDFGNDQISFALTNIAPSSASITLSDITQIAASGGYTIDGIDIVTSSLDTSNTASAKLLLSDTVLTATGGSIGPFRYVVLFDKTVTSGGSPYLIGYYDYASSITLATNESLTLDFAALGAVSFE